MAQPNNFIVGSNTDETLVYKGVVEFIPDDVTGYKPIKCRIQVVDGSIDIKKTEDLTDCYPLLPKHLNVYPKKGEYVYILTLAKGLTQQIRYYIGPVIDTYQNLNYNFEDNTEINSPIKPKLNQPEKGIYPNREQISIQGRNNSDIVFKNQEVLMRAGKYVSGNPLKFNSLDTGYIQILYGTPETKQTKKEKITQIVKLPTFNGFAIADLTNVTGVFDWLVNIRFEDDKNTFIGRIYKTFTSEDSAINFIKETFLDLKKNGSAAKSIKDIVNPSTGNKISVSDFSNFKFVNTSIPRLVKEGFDINPTKSIEEKKETVDVEEVIFNSSQGSVINVVSSKINLISHGNKIGFKLLDPINTISPDEQLKINTDAQPIPYGYNLNDFLTLIKSFVASHVHPYHGLPPDPDPLVNQILNFDLETILNQNVRSA